MRGRAQFLKRGIPAPDYNTPTPTPQNAIVGEEIVVSPYEGYIYLQNGAVELPQQRVVETTGRTIRSWTYFRDSVQVGKKDLDMVISSTSPDAYAEDAFRGGGILIQTYAASNPLDFVNAHIPHLGTYLPIQGNTAIPAGATNS